jgi:protocatechuate 3,4-dioxygenase beta subunit
MESMKRRSFIKKFSLGTSAYLLANSVHAKLKPTPTEIEGPYYPIVEQNDKDADLTRVKGKAGVAKGEIIEVSGQIFDLDSNPIEGATIDLWQANSIGKYHHPHDNNSKPVDEYFQAWAIIQSGAEGRYKFKTIMPGAYSLTPTITRTPHIHYKVGKKGYIPLITQMYFLNHSLNDQDPFIQKKSAQETDQMSAKLIVKTSINITQYQFNMIMKKL